MDTENQRESMEYDVVIVGAGPAGLATAIKLKQLNADINAPINSDIFRYWGILLQIKCALW